MDLAAVLDRVLVVDDRSEALAALLLAHGAERMLLAVDLSLAVPEGIVAPFPRRGTRADAPTWRPEFEVGRQRRNPRSYGLISDPCPGVKELCKKMGPKWPQVVSYAPCITRDIFATSYAKLSHVDNQSCLWTSTT